MSTFDKLKIVTNIDYIQIDDIDRFQQTIKNNTLTELKFNITSPYLLYIEIDYLEKELVIEFSGKILGSDYKKLISTETIRQCFENINSLGVCSLDVGAILEDAIVVKCDVTQDVYCADISVVAEFIRGNMKSYKQFSVKCHRNGNLTIDKSVDTRQAKKRITIYNKSREMKKMDNRKFMNEYNIPDAEFDNMCRFEINLNSKAQIRTSLGIADTRLMSVLTSTRNPIIDFLDDIVANTDEMIPLTDKQTYITTLVLRDCNNDLAEVEEKMRQIYSKGTNISKVMKPYKEALAKKNKSKFTKQDLLQMLR